MHAIDKVEWGKVNVYTWGDLISHQWECFRLALMQIETELLPHGVAVEYSSSDILVITEMKTKGSKIIQSSFVMKSKAEMVVDIVSSNRNYKTEMIKYLPLYERKSEVFNEVIDVDDREFRNLEQQIEISKRNIFIDTAVEALSIYERDLGIEIMNSLNYRQRREQIMSRYRATFDQTTEETIKAVSSAFSNGDVEVNPTLTPGVYEIKFISTKGIPDNINGLMEAIDIIAPAHLEFTYTYTFNAWEFLKDKTWWEITNMTWNELRTWNGVR